MPMASITSQALRLDRYGFGFFARKAGVPGWHAKLQVAQARFLRDGMWRPSTLYYRIKQAPGSVVSARWQKPWQ